MLNVRLAGGHLYGNHLFTRLSLVVSLMASFYAVLFPARCPIHISIFIGGFIYRKKLGVTLKEKNFPNFEKFCAFRLTP